MKRAKIDKLLGFRNEQLAKRKRIKPVNQIVHYLLVVVHQSKTLETFNIKNVSVVFKIISLRSESGRKNTKNTGTSEGFVHAVRH